MGRGFFNVVFDEQQVKAALLGPCGAGIPRETMNDAA
jgi:hypothetical protein